MSTVPNLFANQTGPIPLSQLDANFASFQGSSSVGVGAGLVGYSSANGYASGTVGNALNGMVQLTVPNQWTKNQWVAPTTLTYAATINSDANLGNFRIVPTGNFTLANPTNLVNGMMLNWVIVQDGTGSRIITYGSAFKFPGGAPFALSTAAGAVDMISAYYDSTSGFLLCVGQKGFA